MSAPTVTSSRTRSKRTALAVLAPPRPDLPYFTKYEDYVNAYDIYVAKVQSRRSQAVKPTVKTPVPPKPKPAPPVPSPEEVKKSLEAKAARKKGKNRRRRLSKKLKALKTANEIAKLEASLEETRARPVHTAVRVAKELHSAATAERRSLATIHKMVNTTDKVRDVEAAAKAIDVALRVSKAKEDSVGLSLDITALVDNAKKLATRAEASAPALPSDREHMQKVLQTAMRARSFVRPRVSYAAVTKKNVTAPQASKPVVASVKGKEVTRADAERGYGAPPIGTSIPAFTTWHAGSEAVHASGPKKTNYLQTPSNTAVPKVIHARDDQPGLIHWGGGAGVPSSWVSRAEFARLKDLLDRR